VLKKIIYCVLIYNQERVKNWWKRYYIQKDDGTAIVFDSTNGQAIIENQKFKILIIISSSISPTLTAQFIIYLRLYIVDCLED